MRRPSRRAVLAGGLTAAGAVLALPQVRQYASLLAPGSGALWEGVGSEPSGTVTSPYGDATVTYDAEGVPHIEADGERALQFAHGYVQGTDRLFQLDLFRRQMRGTLSSVAGDATLDMDEFHRRMDFARAAEASRDVLAGGETAAVLGAFVEGVNAASEARTAPVETALLGYDIDAWTTTDSLLIEKLMAWQLTGSFRTLRRDLVAERLGEDIAVDLYPPRFDHDATILQRGTPAHVERPAPDPPDGDLVEWLSAFESPQGLGSNSWVVDGAHTASGGPILANDPHLSLMSPPVWYEVALETPEFATRGVVFPGTPFVVIGRNRRAAWGFTNVPADVMDFYRYDVDGDEYRLGEDWHAFETRTETIPVADGDDVTLEARSTVDGPYLERHDAAVGIAWTGHAATRTIEAVRALQFAESADDLASAIEPWDAPPQNLVYADADGATRYRIVGRVPIREVDGEAVRGDRVFDGSAREASWEGFEPYGESTWSGFIGPEELPHVDDPGVLSTANQRVIDDPPHYFAERHAPPFRARRLQARLDDAVAAGGTSVEEHVAIQQDVHDELAAMLVPDILDAIDGEEGERGRALDALSAWDRHMRTDAWAPVVFATWLEAFREAVFGDAFDAADLEADYWPSDWILATLPADHAWFDRVGERDALVAGAFADAVERAQGYDTYGEYHRSAIDHPFEVGFLNYPRHPMPGSPRTLKNYRREAAVGPGWQQVVDLGDDTAMGRLAGGNSGRPLSPHYRDQLRPWIEGTYKPLTWDPAGERTLTFREGDS